jgi:hypothetical protein
VLATESMATVVGYVAAIGVVSGTVSGKAEGSVVSMGVARLRARVAVLKFLQA